VRNLRPIEGILICGISYLISTLSVVVLGTSVSARTGTLISTVVLGGVACLLVRSTTGGIRPHVNLGLARARFVLYAVLASFAIVIPAMSLEAVVASRYKVPPEIVKGLDEIIRARSLPELFYVILVAAVGAAVCEEFVFRGILQRSLTARLGGWGAILVTSMVFGLLHTVWRLPAAFTLGLFLGVLYWRSQSLLPPVVAHFTINCLAIVAIFVEETYGEASMPLWAREGRPAPVWMIAASAVIFLVLLRALWKEGAPTADGQSCAIAPSAAGEASSGSFSSDGWDGGEGR
jgi:membrane protease YdiL (CAAX protease family)